MQSQTCPALLKYALAMLKYTEAVMPHLTTGSVKEKEAGKKNTAYKKQY